LDNIEKYPGIFGDDPQTQLWLAGHRLDPEKANGTADAENPREKVLSRGFDAGDRMCLVKSEKGRPIVRRPKRKFEIDAPGTGRF
jgi:hypothetical protein